MGTKAGKHPTPRSFCSQPFSVCHQVCDMGAADLRWIQVSACLNRHCACCPGLAAAGMPVKLSGCCRWAALERNIRGRMWSWALSLGRAPLEKSTVASGMAPQSL